MKFLHRFLIFACIPTAHDWSPGQQPPGMPLGICFAGVLGNHPLGRLTDRSGKTFLIGGCYYKSDGEWPVDIKLGADQLGMSAQDVADVVEWLKTY